MKNLVFVLGMLLASLPAFAEHEVEMPSYLKGATYTVTLKNGKQYFFTSDKWKLVDRKPKQQKPVVVEKPKEIIKEVEVIVKEPIYRPFSLGVYLGTGPTSLELVDQGEQQEQAQVEMRNGILAGVSLGYQFDLDWMVRASVLSNETYLLGADWKFGTERR